MYIYIYTSTKNAQIVIVFIYLKLKQEFKEQEEKETLTLKRHHDFSLFSHSYCCTYTTTTDDVSSLTENTFISNPDLPVDDVNIKILKDEGTD